MAQPLDEHSRPLRAFASSRENQVHAKTAKPRRGPVQSRTPKQPAPLRRQGPISQAVCRVRGQEMDACLRRQAVGGKRQLVRDVRYKFDANKTCRTANDPVAVMGISNDTWPMMIRFISLLAGFLSLVGCANPNAPIRTKAGNLTQAQVDEIVERCGGASGMAVIEDATLTIRPASDVAVTGCVLEALHGTGKTTLTTVGNQRYETSGRQ